MILEEDLENLRKRIRLEKDNGNWTNPRYCVVEQIESLIDKYPKERTKIIYRAIESYMKLPLEVWREQDKLRRSMG